MYVCKEGSNIQNACKLLGAEVGDFIEKHLWTKYVLEVCESERIEKYKSQLHEAHLKIKSMEKMANASTSNAEVSNYKIQLFDQMQEIRSLSQLLAEREDQSNEVVDYKDKIKVINNHS